MNEGDIYVGKWTAENMLWGFSAKRKKALLDSLTFHYLGGRFGYRVSELRATIEEDRRLFALHFPKVNLHLTPETYSNRSTWWLQARKIAEGIRRKAVKR